MHPTVDANALPSAGAIVVLGGGHDPQFSATSSAESMRRFIRALDGSSRTIKEIVGRLVGR